MKKTFVETYSSQELETKLLQIAHDIYSQREKTFSDTTSREIERYVTLTSIDQQWMDHLDNIENLREGIWLRGDKQTVLAAYKQEAYTMFEALVGRIHDDIVHKIYRVQPQMPTQAPLQHQAIEIKEEVFGESIAQEAQKAEAQVKAPSSTKGSLSDLAQAMAKAKGQTAVARPGVAAAKIGRNDPCPCRSGKKYKKCHGR